MVQTLKNLLAMQETGCDPWTGKIPLEKEMATHSSVLAWRIPIDTGSLAGYSPWSCRVGDG